MKEQISDSIESRCSGLRGGGALRKEDNSRAFAFVVTKDDGPFYCPKCLSDAVVRKCSEKDDHFAHKANYTPLAMKKDTALHTACRNAIFKALAEAFPDGGWAMERKIDANESKGWPEIIPDISGRIGTTGVCVEVQTSAYTINRIAEKMEYYNKMRAKVLWILPLKSPLKEESNFRPRLFEKYIHSMYFGRIYYWLPGCGSEVMPVHFSPTARFIEVKTFFDKDQQEEVSYGGYFLSYKTIKSPKFGSKANIATDFHDALRRKWSPANSRKEIPHCFIYLDKQEKWWSKDEFKKAEVQKSEIDQHKIPPAISLNWEFLDEYDSYDSEYTE